MQPLALHPCRPALQGGGKKLGGQKKGPGSLMDTKPRLPYQETSVIMQNLLLVESYRRKVGGCGRARPLRPWPRWRARVGVLAHAYGIAILSSCVERHDAPMPMVDFVTSYSRSAMCMPFSWHLQIYL